MCVGKKGRPKYRIYIYGKEKRNGKGDEMKWIGLIDKGNEPATSFIVIDYGCKRTKFPDLRKP